MMTVDGDSYTRIFTSDCAGETDDGWIVAHAYDDVVNTINMSIRAKLPFVEFMLVNAGLASFNIRNINAFCVDQG